MSDHRTRTLRIAVGCTTSASAEPDVLLVAQDVHVTVINAATGEVLSTSPSTHAATTSPPDAHQAPHIGRTCNLLIRGAEPSVFERAEPSVSVRLMVPRPRAQSTSCWLVPRAGASSVSNFVSSGAQLVGRTWVGYRSCRLSLRALGRRGGTSSRGMARNRNRSKCGTVNAAYPCCGV